MWSTVLTLSLALGAAASPVSPLSASDIAAELNLRALANLRAAEGNSSSTGCTVDTAHVRKEWSTLTVDQRREWTSAVKCLYTAPTRSNSSWAPNARTRYDDWVAVHASQTSTIHWTGNFLTWHRHYLYAFERALREECGYTGYQPYWNWFGYTGDLTQTTLFDGSDASLGGNGAFVQHQGIVIGGTNVTMAAGTGGGCISTGPFKDVTLHIGPVDPGQTNLEHVSVTDYNPRCLRRDLTDWPLRQWMTAANLLNITVGAASGSVYDFQTELQGRNLMDPNWIGMHAAGHYPVAGDGSCAYTSPNDPLFWLHHGMVDRMYWMWQALNPTVAKAVAGTRIMFDPSGGMATEDDVVEVGELLGVQTRMIKELYSTLGGAGGEYCYVYV